jgi:Fic family protein
MLNENERLLLSKILYHGGFCTAVLAAHFLEVTPAQARATLIKLVQCNIIAFVL